MGKYAYVKFGIILYHKHTDLSMVFVKIISKGCKKVVKALAP